MLTFQGTRHRFRDGLTVTVRCLIVLVGGLFPAVFLCELGVGAAEKGGVVVETVPYQGWKNNLRLSNGDTELIVTLDVGPRILSYRLSDGKNVFKEYAAQLGKTGEGEWMIRGGHRLSVAPEAPDRSYAPDNGPVAHKVLDKVLGLVRLTSEPDGTAASRRKWMCSWPPREVGSRWYTGSRTSAANPLSYRRGP